MYALDHHGGNEEISGAKGNVLQQELLASIAPEPGATGNKHHAAHCKSRARCQKCGEKDNTYICAQEDQLLTATATCTKNEWLTPKYHLQVVHMDDSDSKRHLPVHLILGASEYAAVKRC